MRSTRWRPATTGAAHHLAGQVGPGDARILADRVRTDRHHHVGWPGNSGLAEAVKVLARGRQQLVWARQRQANLVRSALRAFYPATLAAFGSKLGGREAAAVLGLAPTPDRGRALPHAELVEALRRAGRRRQLDGRAATIQAVLASQQLEAPPVLADAYGQVVAAAVAVIGSLSEQITSLEAALTGAFTTHADAGIVLSQPGSLRSTCQATSQKVKNPGEWVFDHE